MLRRSVNLVNSTNNVYNYQFPWAQKNYRKWWESAMRHFSSTEQEVLTPTENSSTKKTYLHVF